MFHRKTLTVNSARKLFYQITVVDVDWMNFFIWRKNVSFWRYFNFCLFDESTDFKIFDVIVDINKLQKLHFLGYRFLNEGTKDTQ